MTHNRTTARTIGSALAIAWLAFSPALGAQKKGAKASKTKLPDGRVRIGGVILPLDDQSMYVLTNDGQIVVKWTAKTKVALDTNYRQLGTVDGDTIQYKVHSSNQTLAVKLPAGQKYATKTVRANVVEAELKEKWTSARGIEIYATRRADHLPTRAEPFYAGKWTFARGRGKPATLIIGEKTIEVSMKKGGQTHVLVYDALATKDCKPFVHRATVIGKEIDGAIVADEIHLLPIGDDAVGDDPKLPRLLFVGDSISGNYGRGLRAALKGKVNAHHPPTNCGPSAKGAANIVNWMGAYKVKGRGWDVISFNFGHWDAGNSREDYQANLEFVISKMKPTGAKLIWVTTCPVPLGCGQGKVGRKAGRMKLQNEWAAEVMKKHPEIMICDQWQFVKDNKGGVYTEWWRGKNVHFGGEAAAAALGRLLAEHVVGALARGGGRRDARAGVYALPCGSRLSGTPGGVLAGVSLM